MGLQAEYDLVIPGGGINGTGIARDAAGRGFKVLLVEEQTLASATSSIASDLAHGGIRYLENYEFSLVMEALKERDVLMRIAPHLVHSLNFIFPNENSIRPAWKIAAGMALYEGLYRWGSDFKGTLPHVGYINFQKNSSSPLQNFYKSGFHYPDCRMNGARITLENALDAQEKGATILTGTKCIKFREENGKWIVTLQDKDGKKDVVARSVINAGGPWVREILDDNSGLSTEGVPNVRLVQGSHIVLKKNYEGNDAYTLQQPAEKGKKGRIVFVIPYEKDYMLIGTTDVPYKGDPRQVKITEQEKDYLCATFNRSFKQQINPEKIEWEYSGVRPLFDNGKGNASSATRDIYFYPHSTIAPMISVFGGKLTSYRDHSERAINQILKMMGEPVKGAWTATVRLPGGRMVGENFDKFLEGQRNQYKWLPPQLLDRYARTYGGRMDEMLKSAASLSDLGQFFGNEVYGRELNFQIQTEFSNSAHHALYRLTKQGIGMTVEQRKAVEAQYVSLAL